jgi:hypothetical protein
MKENEANSTKFEFLLKLNDNIVCQRYFNVKGFNPKTLNSMEIHDELKEVADEIIHGLKLKTCDYMSANYVQFLNGATDELENEQNDFFTVSIRKDDKNVITRYFEGSLYPPKVRYTVDIRPSLRRILKNFTDILSGKNATTNYLTYKL